MKLTPRSSWPGIGAWWAAPSCGACKQAGFTNLLCRSRRQLDLRDQGAVARFFRRERPEYVFLAAARVGGIRANSTFPAQFIYDNLMIEANIIHQAYLHGVKKLLFLGSSCIYPKFAPQPMQRGISAGRQTGAHQRAVRGGQDRRHQAVPGLQPGVRHLLYLPPCPPISTARATISTCWTPT